MASAPPGGSQLTTDQASIERSGSSRIGVRPGLVFGTTIGVSAFLLFTSQPMIGRLVLPLFGGAPAVWATVLLFFQVLLLLGYLYAHLVATRLSPRRGAALHVAVLIAAAIATILASRDVNALYLPALPVVPALLVVLLALIGPAAFAMTATTPLVSSWYARVRRAGDPDADPRDPYWLYALSNGGSLVSLLAYPLIIEPRLGLAAQRTAWVAGFVILTALMAASAIRLRASLARSELPIESMSTAAGLVEADPAIPAAATEVSTRDRVIWLLLAAVPTGLLSAVTNLVTTDLIAAPLLWVIPLAIYLASFVVAFSARGRRLVPFAIALAPATLTLLWVPIGSVAGWPVVALLVLEYLGLGIVAVALHGRLADRRPVERHLTGFYLVMSAGGALGGAFVAIAAPVLFDGIWEYPLLIAGALGMLAVTAPAAPDRRPIRVLLSGAPMRLIPYALIAVPLVGSMVATDAPGAQTAVRASVIGGLLLLLGGSPRFLALTTTAVLVVAVLLVPTPVLFRDRSFFGVVEVLRDAEKTVLMHGTTRHGSQWLATERHGEPRDYYAPSGPFGDVFDAWGERPAGSIRVVGLGAGALAAYARPEDDLAYYEIDPLVGVVAEDPGWFTFLTDAGASDVRIGDGRLLIAQEPDDSVDLAILDAFSSDTVPAHLVTVEAIADVVRALRPDGIVAVHVSNRYYDLSTPVAAALGSQGLTVLERAYEPTPDEQTRFGATAMRVLVGTTDEATLEALKARGWTPKDTGGVPLTDDFPDLLRYLSLTGG